MKPLQKLILVFMAISLPALALDIYDEVSSAIRSGDARQVASYFGSSIDLTILNREDMYSKAQAELIVKDFFSKHPPKSFILLHKGSSKENTVYGIGNLTTTSGKVFRTSFFLKMSGGRYVIQELRFETE